MVGPSTIHSLKIGAAKFSPRTSTKDASLLLEDDKLTSLAQRFVQEVSSPPPGQFVSTPPTHQSLFSQLKTFAREPGVPNPGEDLKLSASARRYLEAASKNDVVSMQAAEREMYTASAHSFGNLSKLRHKALVVAAKYDALLATHEIVKSVSSVFRDKEFIMAAEAAFITACKCGSYDVIGFYLSEALGDAYPVSLKLRPSVMAWGLYRSSEETSSHELLERVREKNPHVAQIHEHQMALLSSAREGDLAAISHWLEEIGQESPFAIREAAIKAIEANQQLSLEMLLPRLARGVLPELVTIACRHDQLTLADLLMSYIEKTKPQDIFRGYRQEGDEEQQFEPQSLLANGIRGAASAGHLALVKELAARGGQTENCVEAAEAAIRHEQLEVLSWAISKLGVPPPPHKEEFPFRLAAPIGAVPRDPLEGDKILLRKLMTLALELPTREARNLLLMEKGGALCVVSDHIEKAITQGNEETYHALVRSGADRLVLGEALRHVAWALKRDAGKDQELFPLAPILDLFERTAPLTESALPTNNQERILQEHRMAAAKDLADANQHGLLKDLLDRSLLSETILKQAFLSAVGQGSDECFDLLLPHASPTELERAFDAVCGFDPNWTPVRQSRRFLPRLLNSGTFDEDRLVRAAIRLTQDEAGRQEGNAYSGAVSLLEHARFPKTRAAEVYIAIGLTGNQAVNSLLVRWQEVPPNFIALYHAVLSKDLSQLTSALASTEPHVAEALPRAAEYCASHDFPRGVQAITNAAPEKLNLEELLLTAQFHQDETSVGFLVSKGAKVTERNIDEAVSSNNAPRLRALMSAATAREAVRAYLSRIDAGQGLSAEWLNKREDLFRMLRSFDSKHTP